MIHQVAKVNYYSIALRGSRVSFIESQRGFFEENSPIIIIKGTFQTCYPMRACMDSQTNTCQCMNKTYCSITLSWYSIRCMLCCLSLLLHACVEAKEYQFISALLYHMHACMVLVYNIRCNLLFLDVEFTLKGRYFLDTSI